MQEYPTNILILGQANNGPSQEIIKATSDNSVISTFGCKSPLIDTYRKLKDSMNRSDSDIYLMKPNGVHGEIYLNIMNKNGVIINKAIKIITKESSDYKDDIIINLSDVEIVISYKDNDFVYPFDIYVSTHELIRKIKEDCTLGIIPVTIVEVHYDVIGHPCKSLVACNYSKLKMSKSISGMLDNKNQLYHCIEESLRLLVGTNIDVVILANCYLDDTIIDTSYREIVTEDNIFLDIYSDDNQRVYGVLGESSLVSENDLIYVIEANESKKEDNLEEEMFPDGKIKPISFYHILLEFVKCQSLYGIITNAVIGFKPIMENSSSIDKFKIYNDYLNKIADEKSKSFEALISVCVGELYYDNGGTIDNSYIAYAGALVDESYLDTVENYKYNESVKPRTFFQKEQVKEIINLGYVYYRESFLTKRVHVFNSVTRAKGILKYKFISRTLQQLYKEYVPTLNEFIGESLTKDFEKIFNRKITSVLNDFIDNSICEKYDYTVSNYNDGDTVILINLYYTGFLSPIKTIIEMR